MQNAGAVAHCQMAKRKTKKEREAEEIVSAIGSLFVPTEEEWAEGYVRPTSQELEAASYISPRFRNMPQKLADKKITVVDKITGKATGKVKYIQVASKLAESFAVEIQMDPDKRDRPKEVICGNCGEGITVGRLGHIPKVCLKGCKCLCGKRITKSTAYRAGRQHRPASCRNCAATRQHAEKTPEQRAEIARKISLGRTPEQRAEVSRKFHAKKTPEQRAEVARKMRDALTPEQWAEAVRKTTATKAAKKALNRTGAPSSP